MGIRIHRPGTPRIRPKTRAPATSCDASLPQVQAVMEEATALTRALRAAADRIHRGTPVSAAHRTVLRVLYHFGPRTVPQLARSQSVSRQHVQVVVNRLLALQLVGLRKNPTHRRSRYVELLDAGVALVEAMNERRWELLQGLSLELEQTELAETVAVLRALRECLQRATPAV